MASVNCVFHPQIVASWTQSGAPLCQSCADQSTGKHGPESQKYMMGAIKSWQDKKPPNQNDPINHPSHYTSGNIQPLDAIEDWNLNFNLGQVVKYVARAGKKEGSSYEQDLGKAKFYLEREIKNRAGK